MPDLLTEIQDAIGPEALESLLGAYGGVHLRVPMKARPGHPIAGVIGDHAFMRLVAVFGGECLSVPSRHRQRLELRNETIIQEHRHGDCCNTIARRHDLTVRRVFAILAQHRARAA